MRKWSFADNFNGGHSDIALYGADDGYFFGNPIVPTSNGATPDHGQDFALVQADATIETVAGGLSGDALQSVRRLQAGLQSFLSMRRIEARRKNASAFRLRFSQSLASLRQRLSQAMVRSTIQRLGKTTNPLT